jgi:FlaA1/EpsC-like NDP-sugar epimerase
MALGTTCQDVGHAGVRNACFAPLHPAHLVVGCGPTPLKAARPTGWGVSMSAWHGDAVTGAVRRARSDWWLIAIDGCLLLLGWIGALVLRYDGDVPAHAWHGLWFFLPLALPVSLAANGAARLYSGVARHAGLDEARRVIVAQLVTACLLVPAVILLDRPVPASVPVIAAALSIGLVGTLRFRSRLRSSSGREPGDVENLIVIGAGSAGASLVRDIQLWRAQTRVVAFVDDDLALQGRWIHGVQVKGRIEDLPRIAAAGSCTHAILAVPSAVPRMLARVGPLAEGSGLVLRVVPPLTELITGDIRLTDVRDIEISDLLSRGEVDTDLDEVTSLVAGRRVLITGAGGSIGSEIAKQVAHLGASRVVLLDHDETHLFETAPLVPGCVQRLCDIREPAAVDQVFREERPEIVFHAAAHKHVPLLEDHPVEAAETNVFGTRNLVAAAGATGVERFVLISTDKAVQPTSVMGASKSAAEKILLSESDQMTTCAVRFGNVLGSRGSVVPTFLRQIQAGGPVTVTDGRMTRYFMSIPEAVRLVLHAAALARGGEIFMLDMGKPVSIMDLACRMIRLSGRRPGIDVEVRVTGTRPGEKLSEQLHVTEEEECPTAHPSVMRLSPVPVPRRVLMRHLDALLTAVSDRDDESARSVLMALARPVHTHTIPTQQPVACDSVEEATPAWT